MGICEPEDNLRSAFEINELLGCCGTYGSNPAWPTPDAACIPFNAPLADVVCPWTLFVTAGEPCAWACVVWAGEFCDENLELILDIQEFLLGLALSGGVMLPGLSVLPRLSKAGRLTGIFWVANDAEEGVGGGESGVSTI